jgi:hypothetical protein
MRFQVQRAIVERATHIMLLPMQSPAIAYRSHCLRQCRL